MKINKNGLIKFLQVISSQGDVVNNEALLKITTDKIIALSATAGKYAVIYGEFKGEFDDIGDIGIGDIKTFVSFLNNFDDSMVDITKKDNKLVMKSDKDKLKISYILKNTDYLMINNKESRLDEVKFNEIYSKTKGNEIVLTQAIQKKITTYFNSIKATDLVLSGEKNSLKLYVASNENEIVSEMTLETQIQPISIRVGKVFVDILKTMNSDVVFSTYDLQPISLVTEVKDLYKVIYCIAQMKMK
jgi:hypothetical protein